MDMSRVNKAEGGGGGGGGGEGGRGYLLHEMLALVGGQFGGAGGHDGVGGGDVGLLRSVHNGGYRLVVMHAFESLLWIEAMSPRFGGYDRIG